MPKGTSRAEAMLNSEKFKPIASSYAGGKALGTDSQSVSQYKIPLNKIFVKFCGNFLKAFPVNPKATLGLVLSDQHCPIVVLEN